MTAAAQKLTVIPVPGVGAEDVAVASSGPHAGSVFTGTEDGSIWRIDPSDHAVERFAHTGGRPLGIEVFDDGDLLVCDAERGLLLVAAADGAVQTLLDRVGGRPMRFLNNAAIAADGTIFFTDSSLHHSVDRWREDFVQDTRSGRLLQRDVDGTVRVLLDGLAFANGVALSRDEEAVWVAQTRARSLIRWWRTGDRAGTHEECVTDLPGYPDNIARGSDGLIWVSLASPRDGLVEALGRAPMPLRRAVTRVPQRLQPQPKRTVRVQAFDDDAALVHDLDLDAADYHMVTGVREHQGRLWLGSLQEPAVAVLTL